MKWYWVLSCANTVEDPLVTDTDDLKGYDEQDFRRGRPIDNWDGSAWVRATEPEDDGTPDDALQSHLMLPILSSRLRRALERGGVSGIQYLPIQVLRPDGTRIAGYSIANVLRLVPALDRQESTFDVYPAEEPFLDRAGEIRSIRKAVLRAEALEGCHIIRLQEFDVSLYAREHIKNLVVAGGFTGLDFDEVEVSGFGRGPAQSVTTFGGRRGTGKTGRI